MFAMFIIISISYYLSKYIQYKHNEKPFEVVYYICLRLFTSAYALYRLDGIEKLLEIYVYPRNEIIWISVREMCHGK